MATHLFRRYEMFEEKVVGKAIERSHSRALVRFRAVGIVLTAFLLLFLAQAATSAMAQPIFPTSYDMLNGNNENFAYLDRSYNGSGDPTQPNSFLSGGLGDLADGTIATQNWFVVEPPPPANGPYVGWDAFRPPFTNPTITFNFGCTASIEAVTIYVDDSDGGGGVNPPASVNISMGGTFLSFSVTDPPGPEPFSATFSGLGLTGTSLSLTLNRSSQWVFLSEVTFEGSCLYNFSGFFPPADNPPTLNMVKAGSGVPVKFSLSGDQGLNIFAAGYPQSMKIDCETSAPQDDRGNSHRRRKQSYLRPHHRSVHLCLENGERLGWYLSSVDREAE